MPQKLVGGAVSVDVGEPNVTVGEADGVAVKGKDPPLVHQ